jgi:hypothetical protein
MSVIGQWAVGQRRSGKFTAFVHVKRSYGVGVEYIQDGSTGDDALFDTRADALRAIHTVTKAGALQLSQA